jgi:hypothetical protein
MTSIQSSQNQPRRNRDSRAGVRLLNYINDPLSKSSQLRLRSFYKHENNLARNTTEKKLMSEFGYQSKREMYEEFSKQYNEYAKEENGRIVQSRKVKRNEQARFRREKPKTFIIHMELKGTYYKSFYDNDKKKRFLPAEVVYWDSTTSPHTSKNVIKFVGDYLMNDMMYDDGYKTIEVISHRTEIMNVPELEANRRPRIQQPMRRAFVLCNGWLKKGHGIAKYAYDSTDGMCVYHQLTKLLLDPPTHRPTKFVNRVRTSEEALFQFFREFAHHHHEDYPNFTMESGVSTEMIASLCKEIGRNMYAYDDDNKIFHSVTDFTSGHYCPIVFYKLHGHCYVIDDPSVIRSVAEENKKTGHKIITTTVVEETKQANQVIVHHLESFDITQAKEMKEGLYLVKQSHFDGEIFNFIKLHKFVPMTKTKNSSITQIQFQEGFATNKENKKMVTICIDATNGESYTYDQLKRIADLNHVPYTNGGIGSLIVSLLEKTACPREFLSESENKSFRDSHGHTCACCEMVCDYLEIDHIVPLASGGSNDLLNLQCLCKDCHLKKTKEEKELGAYKIKDREGSIFNQVVLDHVVNTHEFKTWQFVEKVPCYSDDVSKKFKVDTTKSRRHNLLYSKYEFPVFCVMDIPRPFSGKIQCGFYYIETLNCYPLRGNGWYSQPMVEYTLENNLITTDNIKAELLPSMKLPNTHFQKPIETLLRAFESEPTLQKLSINSMVGLFGRTKQTASHTKFSLCPYEASTWWGDKLSKSDVFIRTYDLEDQKLYQGIFSENIQIESTKYPLYKQTLEMEAIELHRLETIIKRKGGKIMDRNTDAIRYTRDTEIGFNLYYWDDAKTVHKYQPEVAKELSTEVLPRMVRDRPFNMDVFELPWNTQMDYDGTAEEEAKRIVESNMSCHIDGRAGTGKSYLVNKIIDELKTQGKKHVGFSPTNKGARIIGGNTIHSIYYKYQSNKKKLFDMMQGVEYIFIDEVSMMVQEFYQLFILIKRTFPSMKFIIAGDFGQLPPVKDNWVGDYENSPAMNLLCDGNRIRLSKCRRSDDKLYNLCLQADKVDKYEFKPKQKTYVNIAYTHNTRIKINKECMARYVNETKCETIHVKADKLNPKTQDVMLANGMPILAHTTNKKLRFMNSQLFTIENVTSESLHMKSDCESITMDTKDFHKFFYIGFCLTIHASQGETFTNPYTIYDWYKLCKKAKYVALSRGTNIANIQID